MAQSAVLRLPSVKAKTALSRSSIYKFVADGTFPRPVRLGLRAVGWLEDEVDDWLSARIAQSRDHCVQPPMAGSKDLLNRAGVSRVTDAGAHDLPTASAASVTAASHRERNLRS